MFLKDEPFKQGSEGRKKARVTETERNEEKEMEEKEKEKSKREIYRI
jgi:hypothetical protein